ncbi:UvrD-helicase domain-containing protein [Candidatus Microthrix parvicella]|uniref:UvrD-helicase domain-containing protein n=1 Tax=Candidatus Neomicrothrix parvicella TaxID=41950 RepID=UPI0003632251|nr:ATP-dependent helicase [Candidatus Microthrix parvicella]
MTDLDPADWCSSTDISDTLLIAPPGCGKTELLAKRAASLVRTGALPKGRRILAVTFTNKARDNLAQRLTLHVGPQFKSWISVMNFHGLGLHLYDKHRYVLEDPIREQLPEDRALRSIERSVFECFDVPRTAQNDVRMAIRTAKAGARTDREVMNQLEASGLAAAIAYERVLREDSRLDHDDMLRVGLLIIREPAVAALYAERFACVLVDEAQDLTRVQYDLLEPIGQSCTVFAGDRAQGIYTFAGADPEWVFERIRDRNPDVVKLHKSYRSSPEVLAAVSAVAVALGGTDLTSAVPESWGNRGQVTIASFPTPQEEANWLVDVIRGWTDASMQEHPPRPVSVGVLTRMKPGGRRDLLLQTLQASAIDVETWDFPLHRPEVVQLLNKHVDSVVATVLEPTDQVQELYLRCFEEVAPENASTQIDLRDAADELLDLIGEDKALDELIHRIRISSDLAEPVGHGVHLLTGHSGKGQGFDKVIVLGFEEGQIPSFFVKGFPDEDPKVQEELALLHVMASRAKEELVLTICERVRGYTQQPSRWLRIIEPHAVVVAP